MNTSTVNGTFVGNNYVVLLKLQALAMAACTTKKAHNECTTPTNQAEVEQQLKESHTVAVLLCRRKGTQNISCIPHNVYSHTHTHSHTGLCTPMEATNY